MAQILYFQQNSDYRGWLEDDGNKFARIGFYHAFPVIFVCETKYQTRSRPRHETARRFPIPPCGGVHLSFPTETSFSLFASPAFESGARFSFLFHQPGRCPEDLPRLKVVVTTASKRRPHQFAHAQSFIFMKKAFIALLPIAIVSAALWLKPQTGQMNNGPILYGMGSNGIIYKIDVTTCEVCQILAPTGFLGVLDLVVLPDGNILVLSQDGLRLYDPPNPDPIWSENVTYGGSILAPNGLVYLSSGGATPGLWVFDPASNSTTFIGNWPTNINVSEFFYQGGVLYGLAQEGPPPTSARVIEVNVTNPDQSVIVVTNPPFSANGGTTNNGYTTSVSPSSILRQYDVSTNTYTTLCTFPSGINGLTDLPPGVPEEPCLCTTFAGTVNNQTFNICVPGNVTVPYNNNATLDANDILRYILFSDVGDTLGSIVVQSSSPVIAFNPATMQTGVTYYLATIAGNNAGGNVDLNDPCLDISNQAAQVIWRPLPTVTFSVPNPDVCAGECRTVTTDFTGTPPFTLTYTTPAGTFTQTFSGNTGTFLVCVPAGAPPGALSVQATNLTDAWCECP